MNWILILVALISLACYYLVAIKPSKYWTDRGVIQGSPWPVLGDGWRLFLRLDSFPEFVQYLYKIAPNSRYGGSYRFLMMPSLVLKDPELIKQIAIKDFDHFVDHRTFVPESADPLWANNLFALKGQKWRDMRSTLSPAFTGSKIKQMFGLITDIAEHFVRHFANKNQEVVTVEMKDYSTRFTNDVIASTAFGIECNSLEELDNEFYLMGKKATNFSGFWNIFKFMGFLVLPKLFVYLKVSFFSKEVGEFFTKLVRDNIEKREELGITRPDLINILMEARSKGLKNEETQNFVTVEESSVKAPLTDVDITAQALVFFLAGFDAVSSLMCFMCHELAVNSDIQERLRQEVDQVDQKCTGILTYEALISIKYMDMVTSETLRKWPNTVAVDRICTKAYTIKAKTPQETDLDIDEGMVMWLPIFALHHDQKFFPEPERFDPERFSEENKHKIVPCSYMPFGVGPRNCIGSRFALMEIKVLIFYILREFEIVPVEKTQIPLRASRKHFTMTAENGFWMGLKKRNKV